MKPLSHHEILGWIEPFARRGWQADLAASDRAARRVTFRPVMHPAVEDAPALSERLELECQEDGEFRLVRLLTLAEGQVATLGAQGPDAGALLAAIESIPPARQVARGPGHLVTFDHELDPGAGEPASRLRFTRGVVQLDGFELTVALGSTQKGVPATVELRAVPSRSQEMPQDLLAVLGWRWTRLAVADESWRGELRLNGRGIERARVAERNLLQAVQHLASTFAESPAFFHERQLARRWRVTLRRGVPLLVCLGLIAGAAAVPLLQLAQDSSMRMLLFNVPPLLTLLLFCLPEMPRIEFPPVPRRLPAASWRGVGG
jgi:hypothetical protein